MWALSVTTPRLLFTAKAPNEEDKCNFQSKNKYDAHCVLSNYSDTYTAKSIGSHIKGAVCNWKPPFWGEYPRVRWSSTLRPEATHVIILYGACWPVTQHHWSSGVSHQCAGHVPSVAGPFPFSSSALLPCPTSTSQMSPFFTASILLWGSMMLPAHQRPLRAVSTLRPLTHTLRPPEKLDIQWTRYDVTSSLTWKCSTRKFPLRVISLESAFVIHL